MKWKDGFWIRWKNKHIIRLIKKWENKKRTQLDTFQSLRKQYGISEILYDNIFDTLLVSKVYKTFENIQYQF